MPIYEYACKSCKHTLEALQKMSDDALVDCPECGKQELKRLISAPRFRLKGQGWYETDFKSDNQRNLAKGDTDSVKSDSKVEKTDSKDSKDSKHSKDAKEPKVSKESKTVESSPKTATKSDTA